MLKKDKILNRIKEVVSQTDPDSDIYLYGSRARGNSKSHSDWDILILLDRLIIPFNFETKLMDAIYELELETGEIITPLIYTKSEWNKHSFTPLFENVIREGVRL
jgi:uncharacterized protein